MKALKSYSLAKIYIHIPEIKLIYLLFCTLIVFHKQVFVLKTDITLL